MKKALHTMRGYSLMLLLRLMESLRDAESILDQVISFSGNHIAYKDVLNTIGIIENEILFYSSQINS